MSVSLSRLQVKRSQANLSKECRTSPCYFVLVSYTNVIHFMKYRRLSQEELKDLEQDFINFLASNTVTSEDWVKIKKEFPDRAEKLIEMFSDIVLEKVLTNIAVLEARSKDTVQYVTLDESTMNMVGIKILDNDTIDFRQENSSDEITEKMKKSGGSLQLLSGSRKYEETSQMAKFNMLEGGYGICKDLSLYNTLTELVNQQQA